MFTKGQSQLSTEPLTVTSFSLPCRWCGCSKQSTACTGTCGSKGRKHADLSSLGRLNFFLSLNLAPEPFWWRLPSQTMCSVFLTRVWVRTEIPFVCRLGFLLLFSGKKKSKGAQGQTTTNRASSSKPSKGMFSSSSWYRNNIYLSCSQSTASAAWCMCVRHTCGCLGWWRWVQTQPCNMRLAGTAGHRPR